MGDIRDLKPTSGEQVNFGICQKWGKAVSRPKKETNAHITNWSYQVTKITLSAIANVDECSSSPAYLLTIT